MLHHSLAFKELDGRGWLPLHRAASQPILEVLETVLRVASHGLALEERTTMEGETPLTLAAKAGFVENVKCLLVHGASPHNTNHKNESPLLLAVRSGSYEMAYTLIAKGAWVEQVCLQAWTAMHEAAKVGSTEILMLLLRHGGQVNTKDYVGASPLAVAAEYGHHDIIDILLQSGAKVNHQAFNGESVLSDAAGQGSSKCVQLLLLNGANPNQPCSSGHLPIHKAAYAGHYEVLKMLIPLTSRKAIKQAGQSPVHSAADGGHSQCLDLLIENGFNVNNLMNTRHSDNYKDWRKSALYFAVSNRDFTCTQTLLNAGAKTDLDPLDCLLVAVRAGSYDIVKLLLAKQADVNCYFTVVSNTVFPTALQYCLKDEIMMRLLFNHGYDVEKCFRCNHERPLGTTLTCHGLEGKIPFCEFISLGCLVHLAGAVVRVLLDYVNQIDICYKFQKILEKQSEWEDICKMRENPRSLTHLCRMEIRQRMTLKKLNDTKIMNSEMFPPRIKNYLLYTELNLTACLKIVKAIEQGDITSLQELSGVAGAFNQTDDRGWYPLHKAAVQTVGQVLEVVLFAVRSGSYEMVCALLTRGAWVEQVCLKKWTAIHEAATLGCKGIMSLLLDHGGPSQVKAIDQHGLTPLGIAAEYAHSEVLELLIQNATTRRALRLSGQSPVHSAADGGHVHCLELLLEKGFDVNALLDHHVSDNYGDMRRSPLFFAVSSGDTTCAETLLSSGAKPDLDPLRCLLVAVRAGRYAIVRLLLAKQADVNCYFTVVSDTVFPTALQYCLRDEVMMRLLLNNGYRAEACFSCPHGSDWDDRTDPAHPHHQDEKVPFCDLISVSWLVHLAGKVVRILLDYVSHVAVCGKLKQILQKHKEWSQILKRLDNPCSLSHLCRVRIRKQLTPKRLADPRTMTSFNLPPRLKDYLMFKEQDLYGNILCKEE
ncbi:ankyrin repeat and SOCS box protein 15 [Aplochiton taeniatus]